LSEDSDGHAIFSHLLDVNPNIIKEITADHLKQARPGFAGEDANKSVFYNLAKHNPALLLRIFEGNRALAKAFTLQDLTLPVANDKTALAHLEASPFGQNILKIFGVENPELALTLTFFKNMNNLSVTGTPQTLFNNTTTPSGIEPVTKQPPNRKKTAAGMEIKMR
ncbi:MAG TPA: hypothetical protein VLJ15_06730, partial [Gammaproteobacteria bacterium]|nr:hypothetical protein [Gammaproteobacteria bacterium]